MMMVVFFMAIAAVMAYALLASSISQEQIAYSQQASAQAEALAESGLELGLYYIQYPLQAPTLTAASGNVPAYWPGASNITFPQMSGSATVTISPANTSGTQWNVSSTGTWNYGNGTSVSNSITSTANSTNTFVVRQAIASNTALNLGTNTATTVINSGGPAIITNSGLTVGSHASVTGGAAASSYTGFTGTKLASASSNIVPSFAQVYNYGNGYTYNGTNFLASLINFLLSLLLPGTGNPAGVIYNNGNLTVTSNMTISGMLYVTGNLTVNANVTITPALAGFPALVVGGSTSIVGNSHTLTVNGVAYMGGGLKSTATVTNKVVINGGLLIDQGGIDTTYKGILNVTYNANNVNLNPSGAAVPAFTSAIQFFSPTMMKLSTWSN